MRVATKRFATHMLWFATCLQRTDTVSPEDKRRIQEKMENFESLLDENPFVQKKRAEGLAEGEAKGLAEGEARGEAKGLQRAFVTVIRGRFPRLSDLAQQKVTRITKPDALSLLLEQVSAAPDEETARIILNLIAA